MIRAGALIEDRFLQFWESRLIFGELEIRCWKTALEGLGSADTSFWVSPGRCVRLGWLPVASEAVFMAEMGVSA